jgi:hypothetical protein
MAGQPPQDASWQSGQDNVRAAWPQQPQPEQPPYEPLAQTAKHPVPSFDPPPPGRPGPGYPPPRQEYTAGRPQGYSAGGPGYEAADQQASFDLPGNGQQAAWQAPAQAQARPAAARGKGFLASLFDFGFTSFVTPKLVKALYVLATLWTALWALILLRIGFHYGVAAGLFMLILVVPVFGLLSLGTIRVFLELFMVLHRINENIQSMRDRDGGPV